MPNDYKIYHINNNFAGFFFRLALCQVYEYFVALTIFTSIEMSMCYLTRKFNRERERCQVNNGVK